MSGHRKRRVLMLLGWYYPDSVGGTENYVRLLSSDLKDMGWEPVILAPSHDCNESSYEYEGVMVYRYPVSLDPELSVLRGQSVPRYFENFKETIRQIGPDIVHMHSYTRACGVYHAEFVKNEGIPLVLTPHVPDFVCARGTLLKWGIEICSGEMIVDTCTACFSQMKGVPRNLAAAVAYIPDFVAEMTSNRGSKVSTALSIKKIISARINNSRELFKLSDSIVSVSEWFEKVLLINGVQPEKIYISRHGISQHFQKKRLKSSNSSPLRLGYIGRFKPVKGVHILIEAVKKLPPDIDVALSVYGRADTEEEINYLDYLKTISRKESRIEFKGALAEENRSEAFLDMDILAIPSVWLETGPFVLLEAFSAAVPVIGSDLGGISELVRDGVDGMLVKPGDIAAWTESINTLSEDRELINRYVMSIPETRKSTDVAHDMADIYGKLLQSLSKAGGLPGSRRR